MNAVKVWNLILEKYFINPADKINLLLASPQFFEPILSEQKCAFLFGEVIHILHRKKYLSLSNSAFLEFRCLSKSCKMSLDNSLQMSNPCFMNLDGIDHEKEDPEHVCWSYLSKSKDSYISSKIEMYSELIENGTLTFGASSPFVTGSLAFMEYTDDDDRMLSNRINYKKILTIFGTQICHFQYNLWSFKLWSENGQFPRLATKYQLLCELLEMTPNLKSLMLEDYCDRRNDVELDYECGMSGFELPDLDHLVVLKISNVTAWAVDTIVRKYGPNISKLSVNVSSWLMDDGLWYDGLILPANYVSELSLPFVRDEVNVEEFLKANISCPLSLTSISISLELKFDSSRTFQDLTAALLQVFGSSERLSTINISILSKQDWYSIDANVNHSMFFNTGDRLELPGIRRLWIFAEQVSFNTIDFILGLRDSLEELVLNLDRCLAEERSSPELIQFFGYWYKLKESNVWEMMPRLQKITIRCTKGDENHECPMESYEYNRPI